METGETMRSVMPDATGPSVNPFMANYLTSDGGTINLCIVSPTGYIRDAFEHLGRPELADDTRFSDLGRRRDNEDELTAVIAAWTSGQDKHELAGRLQAAGVAAAPVQTPKDVAEDPYLAHRGFFTELEHPDAGRHRHPSLPFHLSRTPGAQVLPAPPFGWHNRHVLETILKLPPEEIAAIETSDAMATEPLRGA